MTVLSETHKSVSQTLMLQNVQASKLDRSEENSNPQVSVPSSGVRHRPSKRKSIGGTAVNKNKSKKERGKVCRNIHVGLERQIQEVILTIAEENADAPIESVRKCHRGKGGFLENKCLPLKDFTFSMKAL